MGKLEGKKDGSVSILLDRMGSGLYSPNIKWLVPNFQGTSLDALPHWLEPQQSTASKQLVVPQLPPPACQSTNYFDNLLSAASASYSQLAGQSTIELTIELRYHRLQFGSFIVCLTPSSLEQHIR